MVVLLALMCQQVLYAQNLIEIPNVQSSVQIYKSTNGGPSGIATGDQFGRSVADIGDINNDGINDIAVGAPYTNNSGNPDYGAVYICFMNANGTVKSSPAPVKIEHGSSITTPSGTLSLGNSELFGMSVAGIGDLNGDTYEDIVVGAPGTVTQGQTRGSVYIFFLNASGAILSYNQIKHGTITLDINADFGMSVANAGDLNGDGITDIVVGSPGQNSTEGAVWPIRLNSNGTIKSYKELKENTNGFPNSSTVSGDNFGYAVTGAGDLNNDGINDIIAGIPGEDDGYTDAGGFWVLYLDTTSSVITSSAKKISYPFMAERYYPNTSTVGLGRSLNVTDINEDGLKDIVAGVSTFNSNKGGFYFMSLDSTQTVQAIKMTGFQYAWSYTGPATPPQFGAGICEVKNLAGNTFHKQYVVGAHMHANGASTQEGSVYMLTMDSLKYDFGDGFVIGYTKISDVSGKFTGTLANSDFMGYDAAYIGDINGDGYNDIALGAHFNGTNDSGAVWIMMLDSIDRVKAYHKIDNSEVAIGSGENFGTGITCLGDFDHDGVNDIAVGAQNYGASDNGAVYMIYLNNDGTVKASSRIEHHATYNPIPTFSSFGFDVDTIGDLDGNGVVDLVVGASRNDDGGTGTNANRGAVHIVYLKSDGTVKMGRRISDTQGSFSEPLYDNNTFGSGVEGVGDMNGDGIPDIAVGAPNMDGTGAVFIIYLDTNATVKSYTKINNTASNFPATLQSGEGFGFSIQQTPDLDGNGLKDLMIGSYLYKTYGIQRGGIWMAYLDSSANVIDAKIITDSTGLYTNMNATYGFGQAVRLMSSDTSGNMKLLVGTRDDDGGTDRGGAFILNLRNRFSRGYYGFKPYYAELDKKPDGERYNFGNKRVAFRYYDKYHDGDNTLAFKIYNDIGQVVLSSTAITIDPAYGENRIAISCNTLALGNYMLEVTNVKNEKYYLRFTLIAPASMSAVDLLLHE